MMNQDPRAGRWVEVLNTDDVAYGGSDVPAMGWSRRRSPTGPASPPRRG
jgi:hypothetical protein